MIIHNASVIEIDELLALLNDTPLRIDKFVQFDEEVGKKRFGKDGENGVLVFRQINKMAPEHE